MTIGTSISIIEVTFITLIICNFRTNFEGGVQHFIALREILFRVYFCIHTFRHSATFHI